MSKFLSAAVTLLCLLVAGGLSLILALSPNSHPDDRSLGMVMELGIIVSLIYPGIVGFRRQKPLIGSVPALIAILSLTVAIVALMLALRHDVGLGWVTSVGALMLGFFCVTGGHIFARDVIGGWCLEALSDAPRRIGVGAGVYAAVFLFGTSVYPIGSLDKWLQPFLMA
ncbi:MAG: hypothetical protein AB8G17_21125, partial [Gammaproteobacteria bacterium]